MFKRTTIKIALATAVMALSVNVFAVKMLADSDQQSGSKISTQDLLKANSDSMSTGKWVAAGMTTIDSDGQPHSQMVFIRFHPSADHFDFFLSKKSAAVDSATNAPVAFLLHSSKNYSDYMTFSGQAENLGKEGKLIKFSLMPKKIKIVKAKAKSKSVKGNSQDYTLSGSGWNSAGTHTWSFTQGKMSK